jgi:hypothetical protein
MFPELPDHHLVVGVDIAQQFHVARAINYVLEVKYISIGI